MSDDSIRLLQEQIRALQNSVEALRKELGDSMREVREKIDDLNEDHNSKISKIEKRCASRQHVVDAHDKMMSGVSHSGRTDVSMTRDDWFNARVGRWVLALSTGGIGAAIGAVITVWIRSVVR